MRWIKYLMVWWLPLAFLCNFAQWDEPKCRIGLHPTYAKFLKIWKKDKDKPIVAEKCE